ncbi:hypothetical protein ACHAW5_000345 [Stephanodiscus triporus]|uniref:ATPase V1 complex subunit H C-terminal domain-containing protein n=1 Tax=Stephanodiscus triporus TaxID=2934178 RepID=A0ABD3MJR3_9STRA
MNRTMALVAIPPSPVASAFRHIQWDPLSSLRLTPQETALLRMAETNPIEYTLGDPRDATMYVRVLLKLLAEASSGVAGHVGRLGVAEEAVAENRALDALDADPLGVVTHYAIARLHAILVALTSPWASENGVSIANVFYPGQHGDIVEQWKSLLRVVSRGKGDPYAQRSSALCLAVVLLAACPSQRQRQGKESMTASSTTVKEEALAKRVPSYASVIEPLEALTAWLISQLKSSNATTVGTSVPAIMTLMGATEGRQIFAASGGIKHLSRQLRHRGGIRKESSSSSSSSAATGGTSSSSSSSSSSSPRSANSSVQQLYELAFCLWCLTYELNNFADVRADFAKDGLPVAALVELVSSAPREKIVRVALAALRNLAYCSADINPEPDVPRIDSKVFLGEMIGCGLMKAIGLLRDRQFTDPDIVDDIDALERLLVDNFKEMTRWEVYQNEVETGQLQWGSTHTDAFFKENAKMMEGKDGNFELVKILISLVTSKDEDVAAIACFDLGEFCRHYPNGRAIAKRLGAKELAMALIEHDNPELQRHALQCVSKMMVHNWEYVK